MLATNTWKGCWQLTHIMGAGNEHIEYVEWVMETHRRGDGNKHIEYVEWVIETNT